MLRGLAREDLFTVVSEHFITDTARYADIVLPATTQMEQTEIMFSWGHFYLSYNHQAIAPRGEAVPNTELFRRLAKAMGIDDPFFHRDDAQMALDAMDWASPAMEGITMELLQRDGYARQPVHQADQRPAQLPDLLDMLDVEALLARVLDVLVPLKHFVDVGEGASPHRLEQVHLDDQRGRERLLVPYVVRAALLTIPPSQ